MAQIKKNSFLKALDASFVLGIACTVVFYAIVLSPGMKGSVIHRYTTEHAVEYVIVALSFWGLVDIVMKLLSFPRDTLALRHAWLPERKGREPAAAAAVMLETVRTQAGWLRESRIGKRLALALGYVVENGAAVEYREYLDSLAEQDDDRTHANYTLVRFIVRVTPVLGFLGTVVHFGTALSGLSADKMADSMSAVVSEMGQAFNTTTVALASAMFMMFAQFICEWIELAIVRSVDRYVQRELLNRFEAKDANIVPFLGIVKSANDEALQLMAGTLQRQTELWSQALDAVFKRFDQRQQEESRAWTEALDLMGQRHEAYDALREERLRQVMELIESRQEKFMGHIQGTLEKATKLRDDVGELMKTLDSIARGEGKLVELQASLAENLRVIHETQKLDGALHELTGAIHLLTARRPPHAGPHAAAA